ncbi:hypothetical protein B296_00046836 [Ensete ventricosum]|uniref:Uncharacterized protein n=1 Tax=Ensete ventricosum TaxID=4639 RepID=A0A426XHH9_ENSVE|nr:hypothetical protein B296_00046836 [Ensete ventricosum]
MLLLCRVSLTTCHGARLFASTRRPCGCRRLRFSFRAIKKERRKESLFPPRISRPPSNYGAHSKSQLNCSPIPSLLLLDTARAKRRRKEEEEEETCVKGGLLRRPRQLMLLGLISLMLSQTARWISEICVPSSLFSSRFYVCSESDFEDLFTAGGALGPMSASNRSAAAETAKELLGVSANQCPEVSDSLIEFARLLMIWLMDLRVQGYEPFVPFEGLEQLHRFLFILGITHVAYSFVTVVLSMIKVTWLSSLWHMESGFLCWSSNCFLDCHKDLQLEEMGEPSISNVQ